MNINYGAFDSQILLKQSMVIDQQICYPMKHCYEIQKLFQSRFDLYKSIYNHLTVHSVEIILCDILKAAHKVLYNFEEIIFDPEQFTMLSDNILYEIQVSEDVRLKEAQELIKRLHRRDFYPFVSEILHKKQASVRCTEQDIVNYACADDNGYTLRVEDIAVRRYTINYAQGEKSPFDCVKFYNPPRYSSKNFYHHSRDA